MDVAFASIAFADAPRAIENLRLIHERLPAALHASLPALLAQVPDPDAALNFLERYLRPEEGRDTARLVTHLTQHPASLHYLLVVFSYSRFLSETLIQQPELITWLYRPGQRHTLDRLKTAEDLHEEYARFEATSFDDSPAVVLARFKRREYLRIMLRDVLGIASLSDTTLELSRLADVLLDRACRICEQKLQNLFGTPQYADPAGRLQAAQLTILSLGKLGAEELNYSSDIDLMFLYAHEGETSGGSSGSISNAEYFVRLAQSILRLITAATPEGAVFRIDLRLRPQGSEGNLAVSLPTALGYYCQRAREWELQMLIKARCSAGDAETARQLLRTVRPLIYRPEFNLAAVEAVLNAREEISRELRRPRGVSTRPAEHSAAWNVKLSPGGIRDIEFLTQCLQRVYGGAEPWITAPATLVGLQRLHDKGFLSGPDFHRLASAYEFLRRVEHRLQLRDGLQRHTLPQATDALDRLARRCALEVILGTSPGQGLLHRIGQHFSEVLEIYERLLHPILQDSDAGHAAPTDTAIGPGEGSLMRRLRDEFPAVARAVADASAGGDPFVRRGLNRFLSSAILEREVMQDLESHTSWVSLAADLFSRSDLLVEMLARRPANIAAVADPGLAAFRGPLVAASGDFLQAMAALRTAYNRSVVATLVRSLASRSVGTSEPFATFEILTRLAEETLCGAGHLAAREVFGEINLADAPFAVLALGRLGTYEMDIGSDADLVFVVDDRTSPEDRELWRRFAERFVHVVSSHTRDGLLFPVDTRLRPRGGQGEMLQTTSSLAEYFRTEAQGWEAATYLKSRPVTGNLRLGARAIAQVHRTLLKRFRLPAEGAKALAEELARTRQRLEAEGAKARGKGEFKKVAGGYYDLEYLIGYLILSRGPENMPPAPLLRQVAALQAAEVVDAATAKTIRHAALLYRGIDHAVRVMTGRPTHRLPESALAERCLTLLHQWGIPVEGTLEEAVWHARQQSRALYERILLPRA